MSMLGEIKRQILVLDEILRVRPTLNLKKCTRECTKHPLYNYLLYVQLNLQFKAFN